MQRKRLIVSSLGRNSLQTMPLQSKKTVMFVVSRNCWPSWTRIVCGWWLAIFEPIKPLVIYWTAHTFILKSCLQRVKSFGKRFPQLHAKFNASALLFFSFDREKNHEIFKDEKVCSPKRMLFRFGTSYRLSIGNDRTWKEPL